MVSNGEMLSDNASSSLLNGPEADAASRAQLEAAVRATQAEADAVAALRSHSDSFDAMRMLADTMPQIVWITRADGYHEFFNRKWWEYTGLTYDQASGHGWAEVLHPDDRERARDRWTHALQTGEPYEVEYRLARAEDGEYRWFLGRALPYRDVTGAVVRWFGTCTDIHDNKVAQQAAQKAKEQTENASRAKDEFLAILSHELRTPLSAILGWVQLLEMGVLDEVEAKDAIRTIKEQAKVQSQLVEDLLEVSRIINGKFHMRDEAVELPAVVGAAIDAVKLTAVGKGLTIERGNWDDSLFVRGDPQRLQQVTWNLLTNAIKFTPPGGRITIGMERAETSVRMTVTDTGRGIEADMIRKIFDRFQQADSSPTRSQGGMGLGLSIAKHIVTMHGGAICAQSDGKNKGSTFCVLLPIQAVRPDRWELPADRAPVAQDALKGRRLLVVDDEDAARTIVTACLRKFGAEVEPVGSVAAAWKKLQSDSFDAVLSDIAMPEENGYDLVRRLRAADAPLSRTPAVALTAFASIDEQTRAHHAGFDLHVAKPVEPLDLVSRILALIVGRMA